METNGRLERDTFAGQIPPWPGRLFTSDDVQHVLADGELVLNPRTIVTPLAADELRARRVTIVRQGDGPRPTSNRSHWGFAQDRPYAPVTLAIKIHERDGLPILEIPVGDVTGPGPWALSVAKWVAMENGGGGVVFCQDPGLTCCIANKLKGLRAAPSLCVADVSRAILTLGVNLLAVAMPGRTFFEIRQILRVLCQGGGPTCPPEFAALWRS